jgi:NAD(P)H dehydrogenase (quinone)
VKKDGAMAEPTLLVTGAGGQLGRQVVETLLATGVASIVATSRDPARLSDLAAKGVDVRHADFDEPASLQRAFAGVDRMLLVSTDRIDRPGPRLAQHRAAVAAAKAAGVGHIVYTSAPAPQPVPGGALIDDHFWTEVAIFESGLEWTILRNSLYAETTLKSLAHALATGELYTASGHGARSWVSRADCARTAAAVLVGATGRQILDVTGPAALTLADLVAIAAEVSGRPLRHVVVGINDYRKRLKAAGLSAMFVDGMADFDVATARGYNAVVAPTVKAWTNRDPVDIRSVLRAHRSLLVAA